MRNRILAGLGVAALASVGVAAPATAASSTTADVFVVHAVPGLTVNIYVDGNLVTDPETGFLPKAVAEFELPVGPYEIDITAKGVDDAPATLDPADVILSADVTLAANTSYTVVAGLTADGDPTIFPPFVNNLSALGEDEAGVTVRHTAAAPEVRAVVVDDAGENPVNIFGTATLVNGQDARTTVPADTYNVQVRVAAGDGVAISVEDLPLEANTHYFIHAFGSATDENLDVVFFPIAGAVSDIPAGSAGLVAENGSDNGLLIGGAAALLALLIAAGVVVARRTASVER